MTNKEGVNGGQHMRAEAIDVVPPNQPRRRAGQGFSASPHLWGGSICGDCREKKTGIKRRRKLVVRDYFINKREVMMKQLGGLACLCCALIVGILMAPITSDASNQGITISVNGGNPVPITLATTSSCSDSDSKIGYTACYAITAGSYAGVTILNYSSTNTARLLIADNNGSGNSMDLLTLTGLKIVPPANAQIKIVYRNTYDAAPNPTGTYSWGNRIAGQFNPVDGSTLSDFVKLSTVANFGGTNTSVSLSPDLSFQVGASTSPLSVPAAFDVSQVPTYPNASCDTGGSCSPTITSTISFTPVGADQLLLSNSADGGGGDCNLNAPNPGGPPSGTPAHPCMARTKKIQNFFDKQSRADGQAAAQNGATAGVACAPEDECPCLDPDTCASSTISIGKLIDIGCTSEFTCLPATFNFHITGPTNTTASVTTGPLGIGSTSVPVNPGTYTVTEDAGPPGYTLAVSSPNCGGGSTTVTVAPNATVSCNFTNLVIVP